MKLPAAPLSLYWRGCKENCSQQREFLINYLKCYSAADFKAKDIASSERAQRSALGRGAIQQELPHRPQSAATCLFSQLTKAGSQRPAPRRGYPTPSSCAEVYPRPRNTSDVTHKVKHFLPGSVCFANPKSIILR